ncbi:MAG: thrombospondin type 3 repeat-containing protein [Candidatus Magasanikbacteria bacterium]|nr:thrombospondin type 3 repeat-containing protein [Candidatus Magasanikbacteria bacterium]
MKRILIVGLVIFVTAGILITALLLFSNSKEKNNSQKKIDNTQEQITKKVNQFPDDLDMDGILDVEEEKLGTSNKEFDTDGDGLSDKTEIEILGTDPLNPDTDGDGFADGYEVIKGFNPNGEGTF